MIDRTKYLDKFSSMQEIAARYEDDSFKESLENIEYISKHFDVKVLFVGHFSAGKSALINCLIEKEDFLEEDTAPQTSIATELYYTSDKECCYAYKEDKAFVKIPLKHDDLDPNTYTHISCYLQSEALQQLADYTIVDTPGFDSSIENHNKALANYINRGAAYVLVIDVDKGCIDTHALRFLQEVSQYSNRIVVMLNKCDKRTSEDVDAIKTQVEFTLDMEGINAEVYCVSKYDSDISKTLIDIISKFDAQEIYDARVRCGLYHEAVSMKKILKIVQDKAYVDVYELDEEIRRYENTKKNINATFETKRKQAENSLKNSTEEVIGQIHSALDNQVSALAEAAINGGGKAVESIIMETIRPVIVNAVKEIATEEVDDIVHSIVSCTSFEFGHDQDFLDILQNMAEQTKNYITDGSFERLSGLVENNTNDTKGSKAESIYKAVTGVAAITTKIVSPWLELIIVFLPEIVNLVKSIFGESAEDKVKRQLRTVVIPQICNKMREPVSICVEESYNTLLNELQESVLDKLNSIDNQLQNAKSQKENIEKQFQVYTETLKKDIDILDEIINEYRED